MKKLSIEQKAEAYDKALNAIKNLIGAGLVYGDAAVQIFPELKESEDERIRKALINGFNKLDKNAVWYNGITNGQILAWLEKQGEQTSDKIVEKARTEKQRILLTETDGSANIDWDCRSLDDVKVLLKCGLEFIRTIEADKQILPDSRFGGCSFRVPTRYDKGIKQGEQKPNPCDGCINRKGCINCENGELRETEQKPAWSEEDEKMIRGLIVICDEWTTRHSFYPIENCEIEKLKNWLKSLKERYTWKPSDEQMDALAWALSLAKNCGEESAFELRTLHEQLKKL